MNDPDLENLLQSLPPTPPSAALRERVQHDIELDMEWLRPARRKIAPRWLGNVAWGAMGAAAAVAVMTTLPGPTPPASTVATTPAAVMPIHTIREVVSTEDEGVRYNTQSQQPEQHLKVVSVERHAWIDPRDGAEITVEVPHEDSVVLPASFQ